MVEPYTKNARSYYLRKLKKLPTYFDLRYMWAMAREIIPSRRPGLIIKKSIEERI